MRLSSRSQCPKWKCGKWRRVLSKFIRVCVRPPIWELRKWIWWHKCGKRMPTSPQCPWVRLLTSKWRTWRNVLKGKRNNAKPTKSIPTAINKKSMIAKRRNKGLGMTGKMPMRKVQATKEDEWFYLFIHWDINFNSQLSEILKWI